MQTVKNGKGKGLVMAVLFSLVVVEGVPANAENLKVGVINTARILAESEFGKKAQSEFAKEVKTQREELEEKRNEVKEYRNLLKTAKEKKKDKKTLEELNDKLKKNARELKWLKKDLDKKLREKDKELVQNMRARIKVILSQYVEDTEFAVIVQRNNVAAYSSRVDVTDDIIQRLDRRFD